MLKALVISLWRFVTASFSQQSRWLDIMGLRGGRGFQVGSGVIIVAGAARHRGTGGQSFWRPLFFCKGNPAR